MATKKVVSNSPKQDSCGTAANQGDSSVQVRIIQVPAKCGAITTQSNVVTRPHNTISIGQGSQPASCQVTATGTHHTPSSVMVVAKPTTQRGLSQVKPPVANQAVSQASAPGKTMVIAVPRSATPQPVAPVLPQTTTPPISTNIQIPAGMMLVSSDSGQLVLISQQTLIQAQQGARIVSGQAPRILTQQVSTAAGSKSNEKVTVIRMAAPSMFQPPPLQKTAVVIGVAPKSAVVSSHGTTAEQGKPPPIQAASTDAKKEPLVTFSQETLESVKKCKNFLVTLIKLASSDSRSTNMANNVRGLIRNLLEGSIEAEEFTEQLYNELKSTPQPCLVPFLKKSLPAVRSLTADAQLFIQQASSSVCSPTTASSSSKQSITDAGGTMKTSQQETLESVKKCKNFLVTLIKLASSDSRSTNMANNVRGLIRNLLEGSIEAEEFTEQLYNELKSTPQPCLVPFLKKSLPAVRSLTADAQLFIQQASSSVCSPTTVSSSSKQSITDAGGTMKTSQQQALRPGSMSLAQPRKCISTKIGPTVKHMVQSGKHTSGTFLIKQSVALDPTRSTKLSFRETPGCFKEDDDINDVASMAGVNLREENARILTTTVGSVVQSCHDQLFLSPQLVLSRILNTGLAMGVTEVGPEVVALISHATQQYISGLMEKLTVTAEHRRAVLKEDQWYAKESDARSQLRFLEDIERLKKKRKDDEERERLLRLARSRSHTEDPQLQQLKQKAKEFQQLEEALLQQREANLAALAAIGPRKKRALDQAESQGTLLPRPGVQRVTRVTLKDLLMCMEQEPSLRHSLTFYKAMLR